MTDQEHADDIRKAAEALNAAIEAARKAKVYASILTIDEAHHDDWQPTARVIASVVKAI